VTSRPALLAILLALAGTRAAAGFEPDEWLDQLGEKLTLSTPDGQVRAKLGGLIDLDAYHFGQPPPGLIDSTRHTLFAPRVTLFLDGQIGAHIYFFAQARADRGFDPGDRGARFRLDEYAIRVTPWDDGRLSLQVGKFATVLGAWTQRHLSWDNPFINAPAPYEHLTGVSDFEALASVHDLRHIPARERYERLPLIWGPAYSTGLAISGKLAKFEYALEVKNAPPSSRPDSWSATEIGFSHPVFSSRVGYRPNEAWNFGLSASEGAYFRPEAAPTLPHPRSHYHQFLIGQDVSFAWHHLQLWAEIYEARFEVPRLGNADSVAYFLEAKYKFAPQLYGALRWNHQLFGTMRAPDTREPWGRDFWSIDAALGYRFTAHTQLKLQYSLEREEPRSLGHILAAQVTLRF
jgi:hypothetical protein